MGCTTSKTGLPKDVLTEMPEHRLHALAHDGKTYELEKLWAFVFTADGSDQKKWYKGTTPVGEDGKEGVVCYSSDKSALVVAGITELEDYTFDVDWKDDRSKLSAGDTALHVAVRMNRYEAVVMLVDNFLASKEVKNAGGLNAVELSMSLANGRVADADPKMMGFLTEGVMAEGFAENNRYYKDGKRIENV
eukprot:TRINITY_DN8700_c0_g1_i4.p1 TRINITY_DN8700_c0_g1~~TRINITY_DN8700_c0_g1_i4.p1  ORF type:complete len:191 (+),score=43.12 TRINITY_DN8700_c0_g1_i4:40-612(+)